MRHCVRLQAAVIDGYDWVMQTNVIGMGLCADEGLLASKPYAASGNYINKMSDYCKACAYNYRGSHWRKSLSLQFFLLGFSRSPLYSVKVSRQNGLYSHRKNTGAGMPRAFMPGRNRDTGELIRLQELRCFI